MHLQSLKEGVEIFKTILEAVGIVCAGWWFLYTTQFKPRIQFEIECRVLPLDVDKAVLLAEIALVFENKGFVEHRIYDLSLSVHGLSETKGLDDAESATFTKCLFPRQIIVPEKYNWYFVRPGVRQMIIHPVLLHNPGRLIRVTAGFNYSRNSDWPHTSRRFFNIQN